MIRYFILLFLVILPLISFSLQKLDPAFGSIDSLKMVDPLDTLQFPQLSVVEQADTVSQRVEQMSIKVKHKIDSLNALNLPIDQYQHKLDSLTQLQNNLQLTKKIDSLTALELPQEQLTRKLDSLELKYNPLHKVDQKADSAMAWVQEKIDNAKTKVREKLNKAAQGESGDLPGLELPDASLPENMPDLDVPEDALDVPQMGELDLDAEGLGVNTRELGLDTEDLGVDLSLEENLPDLGEHTSQLDELKKLPDQEVAKVKELDEVQSVADQLDKVKEGTDALNQYQDQLTQYSEKAKDLPQTVEEQARNLEQVQALEENAKAFDALKQEQEHYKQQLEQYQDEEYLKEEIKNKAKLVATDHFAAHQDKIQSAQEQLAKYKKKYSSVQSIKDLPKIPPNRMKGKSFIERLSPGFTLQIQRSEQTEMDITPQLGYKISGRWVAGAGFGYRVKFNSKNSTFDDSHPVYGFRHFQHFTVYKGFFLAAYYDLLRHDLAVAKNEMESQWTHNYMAGIGKEYNITNKLRGNLQVLYQLFQSADGPYPNKWNIRFGFHFNLKKGKKKASRSTGAVALKGENPGR